MSPRTRGNRQGSVRKVGGTWYIRFTDHDGKQRERSTDATTKNEAHTILNRTIDRIWGRKGSAKQTLVKDLRPLIEADYRHREQSVYYVTKRWAHLSAPFGTLKVEDVTTDALHKYVELRTSAHSKPATIQQELACLRRMLRLGYAATPRLVDTVPTFPALRFDNVRRFFFEDAEFVRVVAELPDYLAPIATVAFWTGWRKGELVKMQWSQIDLQTGRARLYTSKNKQPRVIVLPAPALLCLAKWRKQTTRIEREIGRLIPLVFHRNGKPLGDFRAAWNSACERAGMAGRWFHDLRRTGVRGYSRAGVSDVVGMKISGHKTRSVFDRYNIVSEGDLEDAAQKRAASLTPPLRATKRGNSKASNGGWQ